MPECDSMWRRRTQIVVAIVLAAPLVAAAPAVRIPTGVVPYHGPLEVADLVRSKPWRYGPILLHYVEEVVSVELRPNAESAGHTWVVLVRGDATFVPPLGGPGSTAKLACVYLEGETLDLLQVQLVTPPGPGQSPGFDSCAGGAASPGSSGRTGAPNPRG
jgi:hypothetical protein